MNRTFTINYSTFSSNSRKDIHDLQLYLSAKIAMFLISLVMRNRTSFITIHFPLCQDRMCRSTESLFYRVLRHGPGSTSHSPAGCHLAGILKSSSVCPIIVLNLLLARHYLKRAAGRSHYINCLFLWKRGRLLCEELLMPCYD